MKNLPVPVMRHLNYRNIRCELLVVQPNGGSLSWKTFAENFE